jgi:Fe-S cluster assembly iron-binding protein IscA
VLAITEDAAAAINSIVARSGLPEGAGLRITHELNTQAEGEARTDLRLSVVEAAEDGDQILEDTHIFLEPKTAELLSDRLLDADMEDGEFRFSLDVQAESRRPRGGGS